jgi:hypothetical protein
MAQAVSRRPPGFDPGSVHVGFVVDKVALGQVFPRVLRFPPVNFIPPVLHYQEKDKMPCVLKSAYVKRTEQKHICSVMLSGSIDTCYF